jgi:hypothetical protein
MTGTLTTGCFPKSGEELGEGLGDALRVVDRHRHAAERDEREAHRHAVVVVGVDRFPA